MNDFVISWASNDEPEPGSNEKGHNDAQLESEQHPRRASDPKTIPGTRPEPGVRPDRKLKENLPCARCEEEHQTQIHALEVDMLNLRQQLEALETKGNLRERQIEEIKKDRTMLRQQVESLKAELVEVQEELVAERRRSWWQRLTGK